MGDYAVYNRITTHSVFGKGQYEGKYEYTTKEQITVYQPVNVEE